jgi:hypothetical protein
MIFVDNIAFGTNKLERLVAYFALVSLNGFLSTMSAKLISHNYFCKILE